MQTKTVSKKRKANRIIRAKKVKYSIPTGVKLAIDKLEISKTNKLHANRFVFKIITNSKIDKKALGGLGDFVQVYSQNFSNSNLWLPHLLKAGIVETDNKFRPSGHINGGPKCLGYRVSTNLLHNPNTLTEADTLKKPQPIKQGLLYKGFISSANTLKIPMPELRVKLDNMVANVTKDSFAINSAIPLGNYKTGFLKKLTNNRGEVIHRVKWEYGYRWLTWSHKEAAKLGVDLILDDNKIIIGSIEKYVKLKRRYMQLYSTLAIERLVNKDYKPNRNLTNNRLDTSFTNFSKELFEIVKQHNGLCEIDCKNSHHALLANKMSKAVDAAFYNVATMGKLYESLALAIDPNISFNPFKGTSQQILAGQKARKKAKLLMMALVFGKANNKPEYLDLFKGMFPGAYEWVVHYKLNNPEGIVASGIQSVKDNYISLPIALALMESQFWIDNVLAECYRKKLVVLSRHDSATCFKKDKDKVYTIIQEAKEKFGYQFKLSL